MRLSLSVEDLYSLISNAVFKGENIYKDEKDIKVCKDQNDLSYFTICKLQGNSAAIFKIHFQAIPDSSELSISDFAADSWRVFNDDDEEVVDHLYIEGMALSFCKHNDGIYSLMCDDKFLYFFFIENKYAEDYNKQKYDFFSYVSCFCRNWKLFESLKLENTSKSHDLDFFFGRIKKEFLRKRLNYVLEEGSVDGIEYKLIKTGNKHLMCTAYYLGSYLCSEYSKADTIKKAKELLAHNRTEEPARERVYNPEYEIPDEVNTSTDAGQKCLEDMNALMKAAIGK